MDAVPLIGRRALWLMGPLMLVSCAGGAGSGPSGSLHAPGFRAALREPGRDLPGDALHALPGLAGLMPLAEGSPERARAEEPFAQVLGGLAWVAPKAPVREGWSGSEVALRAYAAGRATMMNGDAAGAVAQLREATRLDPGASAPWRELGEALLATGARTEGLEALERAMDLGAHDARTVLLMASELLAAGRRDEAAARLAFGALAPASGDPGPRRLILANLASILHATGRYAAAAEACALAHDDGPALIARSAYRRELSDMLQRASQQWTEVSDGLARLGDWAGAARAASQAIDARRGGDELLTDRLARALLLDGRPGEARQAVLDALQGSPALLDERLVILARGVRDAAGMAFGDEALAACEADDTRRGDAFIVWRERVRAAASGPEGREQVLRAALEVYPTDPDLAWDIVWRAEDEPVEAAVQRAVRAVETAPRSAAAVAQALRMSIASSESVMAALRGSPSPGATLLQARAALLAEDPAGALAALADMPGEAGDPASHEAMLVRVQSLAALGRLGEAGDACVDLLAEAPDSPWAFEGLVAVQRFSQATEIAARVLAVRLPSGRALDTGSWSRSAAALALSLGEPERAWAIQDARSAADAFDAVLLLARMQRHLPRGPRPDQAALTEIATRLRERLAGSTAVRRAVTGEFAQRGMFAQAEARAESLARERWGSPAAAETLWQIWEAWERREPGAGASRALAFAAAIEAEGGDPERALAARARALRIAGRLDEARAVLVELAPLAGLFAVELEAFTRSVQRDEAGAKALRRARLAAAPPSVPVLIERAAFAAEEAEVEAFVGAAEAIPGWCELLPAQRVMLGRAVDDAAAHTAAARDSTLAEAWERIAAGALAQGCELGPASHAYRLSILALREAGNLEAIADAVALATDAHPAQSRALRYAPVRALIEAGRLTDASGVMGLLVPADPQATAEIWDSWIRLTAQAGDDAQVRKMAQALPGGEIALEITRVLGPAPEGPTPADPRADLLYRVAGLLSFFGRDAIADELHEACLALDPGHIWASNDHGYRLALRGERLDEAERMLARAARAMPQHPGITDSLGWVRYRLGVLRDDVDEGGAIVRESAITLLSRAVALSGDDASAEVLEHLGDALWQVNRKDDAQERWRQALVRAEADVAATPPGPEGSPQARMRGMAEERVAGLRARLDAAASGVPPPVAPLMRAPN